MQCVVCYLAETLPDPPKALDQLKKLNELMRDDKRLRALMKYLVSSDCNCRKANDNVVRSFAHRPS